MSIVQAGQQDRILRVFAPMLGAGAITAFILALPLPELENARAPAGIAWVPESLLPGSGPAVFLFLVSLLVIRLAVRDATDRITPFLVPVLILTNPVLLFLTSDANATAILPALVLMIWAAGLLGRRRFESGSILLGLTMMAFYLSSPYAAPFAVPMLAGLALIVPRRFIRSDTGGFLIILVLPLVFAIASIAYLGSISGSQMADALFRPARYFTESGTPWLSRYGGHVLTPLAVSALWCAGLALPALLCLPGGLGKLQARQAAFAMALPVLALTIASCFSIALPPLIAFAAMVLAGLTGLRGNGWRSILPALIFAWGVGLLAAMLYGPL